MKIEVEVGSDRDRGVSFNSLEDAPTECILLSGGGKVVIRQAGDAITIGSSGSMFWQTSDQEGPFTLAPSQKITVTFDAT